MFGFLSVLIVVGGLATFVAFGDPGHARFAPYLGFVFLFAGLGALLLSVGLTMPAELLRYHEVAGFLFFAGYAIGGLGGAVLGLFKAVKWRSRNESKASE
ncbi:MAG TPA: hypothetical protein VIT88_14125 [Pyrinomonadaceae bacterium]